MSPWKITELGTEKISIGNQFSNICTLDGASDFGTHNLRQDARLICAAPELLKACKILFELHYDGYIVFDEYGFKEDNDIIKYVENIFKKVEGND